MTHPAAAQNQGRSPVVIEMFTSQACAVCPGVEEMLKPLMRREDVIGLNCHVDYFSPKQAPLGRDFCTAKQTTYIKRMGKGTHYTPHVVMNGHIDAPLAVDGNVATPLQQAIEEQISPIVIKKISNDQFRYTLPPISNKSDVELWYAEIEKPINAQAAAGRYRGKNFTYNNMVGALSVIDGWQLASRQALKADLGATTEGFALFAQHKSDGRIVAAGQYLK